MTKQMAKFYMWVAQGIFLMALLIVCAMILGFGIARVVDKNRGEDATFMMECVYGWGQTPENCATILRGESPPPLPEEEDEEQC